MRPQAVVLLACAPSEVEVLKAFLPRKARVVAAESMQGAIEQISQGVDAVVCSMQFDESRMLELVQEAHAHRPELPVICCNVDATRCSSRFLPAAAAAALSVGVAAFVDLADRAPGIGPDAGELAAMLLRLLGVAG